ncbi:MAG TPA: glycosyltransferase family 2 protein [Xanthomonadaceae bacterium]|nr:glycosyltransferase family 2 protein [Xanthomonadaceae bacterium]
MVVVTHDSGATLARCLDALLAQDLALEAIVVDNDSRDGALSVLPADPRIRLLLNPDNRGFARACNQGAALAHGDRLLFLNPDAFLPEGALAALCAQLDAEPALGVLGAQLIGPDGSAQHAARRRDPTPLAAMARALGLEGRLGLPRVELADRDDGARVQAVSGAAMLVRRTAFEAVGGFDAGYVLHFEDLDLCRRLREAGHGVALASSVRVTHVKGSSSRRRPYWVAWHKHRGMLRYFRRFDAARSSLMALAMPVLVWTHYFAVEVPRIALRALRRAPGA